MSPNTSHASVSPAGSRADEGTTSALGAPGLHPCLEPPSQRRWPLGLILPRHLPQEKHLGTPCSLKKGPVPDVPLAPKLLLWWRGLDPHPRTKPGSQEGRSCPKDGCEQTRGPL